MLFSTVLPSLERVIRLLIICFPEFHKHITLFYSLSGDTGEKKTTPKNNSKKTLKSPHPQLVGRLVCFECCSC